MSADPLVGTLFAGRFEIDALLGSGGTGTVYRARHAVLRRQMALKLLHPKLLADPKMQARFQREARAASLIEHPHLTQVYDFGSDEEGTPYLAMEYAEGPSLAEALTQVGPFAVPRAVEVLIQIGEALQAAHEAGVVHRDLKPGNVILTTSPEGETDQVKVLDFGTAKIFGPEETTELSTQGFTFGTPQYMSPEQLSGDPLDHRTDLYSFGILAYELLTGAPPFGGGFVEVAKAHLGQDPVAPSEAAGRDDVPAALDEVVLQCLAKAPGERFLHAGLLLEALRVIR